MMSDKFVVSTNTVGEIIVTDVETGNVYHYGSMSNFLGLIRLLNKQENTIKQLKEENKNCGTCKHLQIDGMFGMWCDLDKDWENVEYCSDWER